MRRPLLDCKLMIVGGEYLLFCSDLWGVVAKKHYTYIAVYGSKLCFEEKNPSLRNHFTAWSVVRLKCHVSCML